MSRRRIAVRGILVLALAGLGLPASAQAGGGADARSLHRQGREAQLAEDLPRAVELYRDALSLNPTYLEPMLGLAETFFEMEEYEESLRYVQQARRYAQGHIPLQILEGRIRIALGQWEQAGSLLQAVLAREPNNLEARFGLAELEIVSGRKQAAAGRYQDALRVAPESRKALLSLVLLKESEGDLESAQRYLELAVRYHSADPEVQQAAGQFAFRRGRLELAEQHLLAAISLRAGLPPARRALAGVYLSQGRAEQAVGLLQEMVKRNPRDPLARYLLGLAYQQAGDGQGVVAALSETLRLRPGDEIARALLEGFAMDELAESDSTRQKLSAWHMEQGRLLEGRNFLEKALFEYRRSLQLAPESGEARLAFARMFRILGYPVKYLKELEVMKALGQADSRVLDAIELTAAEVADRVANDWSIDQYDYDLADESLKLAVFTIPARSSTIHRDAEKVLTRYLGDILRRSERVAVFPGPPGSPIVPGFDAAFRLARENGQDYFLLVALEESERSFAATAEVYLARTGSLLATLQAFRTGNDRVRDSLMRIASRVEELLPVRGRLLARRFDTGIVDLGRLSGIRQDEKLLVIHRDRLQLSGERVGFSYREEDVLGEFTVTRLDENLCEGTIARKSFFDQINPYDHVIRPAPAAQEGGPAESGGPRQGEAETGLVRRLFRLFSRPVD